MKPHPTDCGLSFYHEPHIYKNSDGYTRACDGSIDKRTDTSEEN